MRKESGAEKESSGKESGAEEKSSGKKSSSEKESGKKEIRNCKSFRIKNRLFKEGGFLCLKRRFCFSIIFLSF
jgi:hypothetical protein